MTKKEFLELLRENLEGNIPSSEIDENIRYYRDYIENGEETEEEALEKLGEPNLIAKTVIDAFKASKGPMAGYYTEQARDEYSKSRSEGDVEGGDGTGYGKNGGPFGRFTRVEKIVAAALLIVAAAMLFMFGGIAAVFIIRIVVPVAILLFLIKIIKDYFGKG